MFTDIMSGKSMERPGLAELLGYARRGDTLAIVRLDRLGRSLGELLTTVQMLRERDIALLSLEEKIDTSSAAGELIFHVFGTIAHFGATADLRAHPRRHRRGAREGEAAGAAAARRRQGERRRSSWSPQAFPRPKRRGSSGSGGPRSTGR